MPRWLYIYLAFTSNPAIMSNSETVPPLANSDHNGALLELKKKPDRAEKSKVRLFGGIHMLISNVHVN